jgi:glycosyltransferase involved in cell wall biosynthesis
MRCCAIVPTFDGERSVGDVVRSLASTWREPGSILVVDDGSTDATARVARAAGALVVAHPVNRGKGAALRTGLGRALEAGFDVAVTVDADGQHPADEAARLANPTLDEDALVLGIRDLAAAGAPKPNQQSNAISNFFLSAFAGQKLADTQCGLRRYPIASTLALDARDDGYAFEAEVILLAIAAGVPIVELPIRVFYPPEKERITHFDSVRDPMRIIGRVVRTLAATGGMKHAAPARTRLGPAGVWPTTRRSAPGAARSVGKGEENVHIEGAPSVGRP